VRRPRDHDVRERTPPGGWRVRQSSSDRIFQRCCVYLHVACDQDCRNARALEIIRYLCFGVPEEYRDAEREG